MEISSEVFFKETEEKAFHGKKKAFQKLERSGMFGNIKREKKNLK